LSNLRATNEPLFTVTEQPSSAAESSEENKDEGTPAVRTRKKGTVEQLPPNILLQPPPTVAQSPNLRKFLSPTLGDGGTRIEKERQGGLKKRTTRISSGECKKEFFCL